MVKPCEFGLEPRRLNDFGSGPVTPYQLPAWQPGESWEDYRREEDAYLEAVYRAGECTRIDPRSPEQRRKWAEFDAMFARERARAEALIQQYIALGSPACADFDCSEELQLAWLRFLRQWIAPDGTAHSTREFAEECCRDDDMSVYGREGVEHRRVHDARYVEPPGDELPRLRRRDDTIK